MLSWDKISNFIIAVAAIGLLIVGSCLALAYNDRTQAAGVVLGFAFLCLILLVCSRFKHVKGFGFEAEMWDQKQIEAAALIDRLKLLSESNAQQTALIAAHLGLMDSGLTNPQLAELLVQTEQTLVAVGTPKSKRYEFTAPLIERIKMNYFFAAIRVAQQAFDHAAEDIGKSIQKANPETRDTLIAQSAQLNQVQQKITHLPMKQFLEANSLNPIIDVVRASPTFDNRDKLLETLSEFDEDFRFFATNLRLKRNIDLGYIYK
jgi:hypothetical protein